MSRKNVLTPFAAINAGDASETTLTSTYVNIQYLDSIGFQCVWTGTALGTFDVQVSNTYNPETATAGTWTSYTVTDFPEPDGSAGNGVATVTSCPFAWLRVVYTKTSGTGTVSVIISGKSN
jgi:hypothetical protein